MRQACPAAMLVHRPGREIALADPGCRPASVRKTRKPASPFRWCSRRPPRSSARADGGRASPATADRAGWPWPIRSPRDGHACASLPCLWCYSRKSMTGANDDLTADDSGAAPLRAEPDLRLHPPHLPWQMWRLTPCHRPSPRNGRRAGALFRWRPSASPYTHPRRTAYHTISRPWAGGDAADGSSAKVTSAPTSPPASTSILLPATPFMPRGSPATAGSGRRHRMAGRRPGRRQIGDAKAL